MFMEMMKAVAQLSADQLQELREYIQQHEQQDSPIQAATLNIEALLAGFAEMRDGLSPEEFREIERAMNEELPHSKAILSASPC